MGKAEQPISINLRDSEWLQVTFRVTFMVTSYNLQEIVWVRFER